MTYSQFFSRETPQKEPLPDTAQVPNSAGGYSWAVDHWTRLRRFLILGSEGGTYYISARKLTLDNAAAILDCLKEDGPRTVSEIVEISQTGRAPKNDPAIFALALAVSKGDGTTRRAALDALPKVCRIGTHLFQFAESIKALRGWSRMLRRGVGNWYNGMEADRLAYQVIKYRQRGGWTHTDLLRLAHPKPVDAEHQSIYRWLTHADDETLYNDDETPQTDSWAMIRAFRMVQAATDVKSVSDLIVAYNLPREAIPTDWLKNPDVWMALLVNMPMTAMLRNLATMTKIGLLAPMSGTEKTIAERLLDQDRLVKARIHPIAILAALRTYASGTTRRGETYQPNQRIFDALNEAFYLAFKAVEPANKRMMLALDVSGSMAWNSCAGIEGLTPRAGSAAMAMITARTEPHYHIMAFSDTLVPVGLSQSMRLDDILCHLDSISMGGTDCALPMLYARDNRIPVDCFVVYTDSETWAGAIHPARALQLYRDAMGIKARLVVVAMEGNAFTLADPNDTGMLDMVGFDSAAPGLISAFARYEL